MSSKHSNLPTEAENIQAAQIRLVRVLESLKSRENEIEHLRERVYRLHAELKAAERVLDQIYLTEPTVSIQQIKAKIFNYFRTYK